MRLKHPVQFAETAQRVSGATGDMIMYSCTIDPPSRSSCGGPLHNARSVGFACGVTIDTRATTTELSADFAHGKLCMSQHIPFGTWAYRLKTGNDQHTDDRY
jgi:hypothetical protein